MAVIGPEDNIFGIIAGRVLTAAKYTTLFLFVLVFANTHKYIDYIDDVWRKIPR